ncbi:hypothetical protein EUX98_g3724 [Antrodiella citrinella]|uniref:Meiotically up-regulated protein Msb1/Mug8 domain-containing protein n=1 Tax=Antrodiella citrinella TaxID=2447956 RepID=A0A4S4MVW1_9APHY|nr:hypothetical protein EUX98_g3724 [Antrodiella citrinella]
MPSFFSKVFGRKKDDKPAAHARRHSASASLLEGKYEAVSPTTSPTSDKFHSDQGKEKEKDAGFSLFRPRSRSTASPKDENGKSSSHKPRLELNLTVARVPKTRTLGVVFEGADDRGILPVTVISERRLTPSESLLLVKACAAAIVDRGGLETLGVMHPHCSTTTLSPETDSPSLLFNSELSYTRSPHDIAAVLRWALRHLQLEGPSFGSSSDTEDVWRWYSSFTEAERAANYPPTAFSGSLVPSIPASHLQLLTATLDIISSLAAHAETNGSSGSKLAKFFGLWLLTAQRAMETDDWATFYARWEKAGRIFEHLFLSYVRDEAEKKKIPLRLAELVKPFPYGNNLDEGLLTRPRFSTRRYDALFVRISTGLPASTTSKPNQHPLQLIEGAFKAEASATGDYAQLWEQLKHAAIDDGDAKKGVRSGLSRIFDDDTIRILSVVPVEDDNTKAVTVATPAPHEVRPTRRRSTSLGPVTRANGGANGKVQIASPSPASIPLPASPTVWADFSTAGFGESLGTDLAATLLDDDDVEVTNPPHAAPKRKDSGKKRKATSSPPASRRSSADNPRPLLQRPAAEAAPIDVLKSAKTRTSLISLIKLDEAFIDFWSDALTDPALTTNWPTFVLCQLKANLPATVTSSDGKPIKWLVVEHAFTYPPPPPPAPEPASPRRAASPRPSIQSNISSRKSSTFTSRTRFNFFSSSNASGENKSPASPTGAPRTSFSLKSPGARKRAAKAPRVGEMGEVLADVEESPKSTETENALGLGISTPKVAAATSQVPVPVVAIHTPQTVLASIPEAEKKEEVAPAEVAASTEPLKTEVTTDLATEDKALPETPVVDELTVPTKPVTSIQEPTPAELPPVPLVATEPTTAPDALVPVAVEPIVLDGETFQKPSHSHPEAVSVSLEGKTTSDTIAADNVDDNDVLPPAPEPIVLSGSTPGPQVALSTSEPTALAGAAVAADGSQDRAPVQSQEAPSSTPVDVPGLESINTASPALKQHHDGDDDEDIAPVPLPVSIPQPGFDHIESSTSPPEIPAVAPTVVEETVKDDIPASEPTESGSVGAPFDAIIDETSAVLTPEPTEQDTAVQVLVADSEAAKESSGQPVSLEITEAAFKETETEALPRADPSTLSESTEPDVDPTAGGSAFNDDVPDASEDVQDVEDIQDASTSIDPDTVETTEGSTTGATEDHAELESSTAVAAPTVPDIQAYIIDDSSPPTTGEAEANIPSAEGPLSDSADGSGQPDAPAAESIETPEEQASAPPKENEPAADLTEDSAEPAAAVEQEVEAETKEDDVPKP